MNETGVELTDASEVQNPGPDPGVTDGRLRTRRSSVKGRSGVYFRETAAGRRYEVSWTDTEGRRRWRTVPGVNNLADALALLEEERAKTRRGERPVPAKAPRLAEFADEWLASKTRLRERTREKYEVNLRLHVKPRLGRLRVSDVRVDDVVGLIRELERSGLSGSTVGGVLVALGGLLNEAVYRGLLPTNPVRLLRRDDRPVRQVKEKRVLDPDEIERLLDAAIATYRPLLATAVSSGLRLSELLGLRWCDVDFDAGLLHVRHQWDRSGVYSPLKTKASKRSVPLGSALSRLLAEHKLGSRFSSPEDPVFASANGNPFCWRNVERRGMDRAVKDAGLDSVPGRRRPTLHDLRDTFASGLIEAGLDVVQVSRLMGHADPAITLRVYADLFNLARGAERALLAIDSAFGTALEPRGGDRRRTSVRSEAQITPIQAVSSTGGD